MIKNCKTKTQSSKADIFQLGSYENLFNLLEFCCTFVNGFLEEKFVCFVFLFVLVLILHVIFNERHQTVFIDGYELSVGHGGSFFSPGGNREGKSYGIDDYLHSL